MIDCLYTGQATDSQDCWWGEGYTTKTAPTALERVILWLHMINEYNRKEPESCE